MATESGAVWAIDIGDNSLKALHLSASGGAVEVIGFDNIQHGKILTGTGVKREERDELIALSLRQFVKQNDLGNDDVIVSVPSQNSFARFVNLPPVEPKRIPEIVRFEAAQQIPFDIDDVQWDWQLMTEPGSGEPSPLDGRGENKVGIFAIKNDVVSSALEHYSRENITVSYVQMAPMALYNYALYDRSDLGDSDNQAIVVLNIGAENTDLVVCTRSTVWQRAIPMGGNAFTRAVADTFKLSFEKAEKLKCTAAMSKYARQILQAMKPVFTDLASEIQRSMGFYNSSNPGTKLSKIIALGGGTKMRGLLKYLAQSLRIPVERPDSFTKLAISSSVSAAKFHENVCDFGVVYGLALQGLGLGRIESNLLPRSVARSMAWAAKAKYFTAAALVLLLVSVLCLARTFMDRANYRGNNRRRQEIGSVIGTARQTSRKLKAQRDKAPGSEAIIQKGFDLFEYRDVVPLLYQTIISSLPNEKNNPERKELYQAFTAGDVEKVRQIPRKERKQIFITSISANFTGDIAFAGFSGADFTRGGGSVKRGGTKSFDEFDEEEELYGRQMSQQYQFRPTSSAIGAGGGAVEEEGIEDRAGFVVTIAGYSPYKNIGELIYPTGVGDDQGRWGVVTRLLHLDDIADGNSPFKLYGTTEVEHFKLEKGVVDLDAEIPAGIGLRERGTGDEGRGTILIDPMTKEIISKVADLDEDGKEKIDRQGKVIYKENDHWFILNVKFIWKDAPPAPSEVEEG